ncbi:hypothetical protein RQP46_001147 [Phenoliferia psychrophenolica]
MMKRLSFSKDAEPYLVPPSLQGTTPGSPSAAPRTPLSAPPSPSRSYPPSPTQQGSYFPVQPVVERPTLHKSLAALSGVLVSLDEVRDLVARIGKAQKKLSKSQRELASTFGDKVEPGARSEIVAAALMASASMFEALSEVDGRQAKFLQKEYEAANDLSAKVFKRIAKEEKAYDETLSNLDSKVQKANASFEKSRPRQPASSPAALHNANETHSKYIATLSTLSASIASVKKSHSESVGDHRQRAMREVARILCGVADASWRSRVEATKKGGERAGEVVARGVWCESSMPGLAPEEEEAVPAAVSPSIQQQQTSTRGPRPLYTTADSTYSVSSHWQQQPDPALFQPAPGLAANTYLVQLSPSQHAYNDQHSASRNGDSDSLRTRTTTTGTSAGRDNSNSSSTRHTVIESSPYSSEDGSSSQPAQRSDDRIVAPKGFLLDEDDPSSPTFQRESRSREEEKSVSTPAPSVSWARDDRSPPATTTTTTRELERQESTASERNFVARMREKYAEEKAQTRDQPTGSGSRGGGDEGWATSSSRSRAEERSEPQPPVRSSSRVSNLAQRYSQPPPTAAPTPASAAPRPTHRYSHSMQPVGSSGSSSTRPFDMSTSSSSRGGGGYDEFGARDQSAFGSPPLSGPGQRPSYTDRDRPYSRQSLPPPPSNGVYSSSPTRMGMGDEEEHSDICGVGLNVAFGSYLAEHAGLKKYQE